MNNVKEDEKKENKNNTLKLIPKIEKYIQYMLEILVLLPRVEKFSIGNEYKQSMYEMLKYVVMLSKTNKKDILKYLNKIDG